MTSTHSVVGVAGSLAPVGGVLITVPAGLSVGPSTGPSLVVTAMLSSKGEVCIDLSKYGVSIVVCHSPVRAVGRTVSDHSSGPTA